MSVTIATSALTLGTDASAGELPSAYAINGSVRDKVGRALAGTTVSDGTKSTSADETGGYRLPQTTTGYYEISASRSNIDNYFGSIDVLVPIDSLAVHNIEATYRLTMTLGTHDVSVANGAAVVPVVVDTWAPDDATTCVSILDGRTGSTHAASRTSSGGDGSSRWTVDIPVPVGAADGRFTVSASAMDCVSSTVITRVRTAQYSVDSSAPVFSAVWPLDGQNTYFPNQPLQATVEDVGPSGFGIGAIEFTLTNQMTGQVFELTGSYNSYNRVATTPPVALVDGHDYTLEVTATDRAGNATAESHRPYSGDDPAADGGFRKIDLDAGSAAASFVDSRTGSLGVSCAVTDAPGDPLHRVATCDNVALKLSDAPVAVSDSRHSYGTGYVLHTTALRSATISHSVGPISRTVEVGSNGVGSRWSPRTLPLEFTAGDRAELPESFVAAGTQVTLETLTIQLDQTWAGVESVLLQLDAETTYKSDDGVVVTGACPSSAPTDRRWTCTTDPLWSRFTVDVSGTQAERESTLESHVALGATLLDDWRFPDLLVYDAILSPGIRTAIANDADVTQMLPAGNTVEAIRASWHGERSTTALHDSVAGQLTDSFNEGLADLRLPVDAAIPAKVTTRLPFEATFPGEVQSPDPQSEAMEFEVTIKPSFPLNSGVVTNASGARSVSYGADGGYGVELYPLSSGGLRYTIRVDSAAAPSDYSFALGLPSGVEALPGKEGSLILALDSADTAAPIVGQFTPPRAFDRYGRPVAVTQTVSGGNLVVSLQAASDTAFPVLIDPQYNIASCSSSSLSRRAPDYLRPPSSSRMDCPYWHSFYWATDYWPINGLVQHGGWRTVDPSPSSECSGDVPGGVWPDNDTGSYWDFQVPCQMHDYCYDLIRIAGPFDYRFVSKADCDTEFRDAMLEHCKGRDPMTRWPCTGRAYAYYAAVNAFGDPPEGSLPGGKGWPDWYNQFLWNGKFNQGSAYWTMSGGSASVRDGGWHKYVRMQCTSSSCRLSQLVSVDDYFKPFAGGETLEAVAQVRCAGTSPCPMRVRLVGRTSLGAEYTLATFDYTAPVHSPEVWWEPGLFKTLPEGPWYKIRFDVISLSSQPLDVRFPSLKFG